MQRRALGSNGLDVPAIGLGCVGMSDLYGPCDPDASVATIRRALELGVDHFDSSDVYGAGHNEELLGATLVGRRDGVVLATKFGALRTPSGPAVDGRPEYVVAACDASLARLRTDRIDVYYQHRVDPSTAVEDTVGAMASLVTAGKVRHLGLSECSASTLRRAHAVHPISVVQIEYSLFARHAEADLLPVCRELGVGVVAYSPLGRGMLSGMVSDLATLSADDYRHHDPRYAPANLAHNLQLVQALAGAAQRRGCTTGQLALAWLLHTGPDVVAIPGTTRPRHLDENAGAAAVELTAADVAELSALFPPGAVAGERYPPGELARVNL